MNSRKPKVAVYKFASCDGCQLSLLDVEDELLAIAGAVDIAYFPEASRRMARGPYDIGLVEGSVTTPHDVERIRAIRKECRMLITIGACATAGGIQALRNWKDVKEFTRIVYANPDYISTLDRSLPIGSFVHVDFELRGCPINKAQLFDLLLAVLHRRKPNISSHSLCVECKLKGNVCVMVSKGKFCLGPVTHVGCGALCPGYQRGCYGCFGPMDSANTSALANRFAELGAAKEEVKLAFRSFNAYAEAFRRESDAHE
ncbi:MAG TPA: oxidoreductase [Bacteroidota bacterium]|nr:oxidoreductase [Bacteroidota bacterium]